MRKNNPTTKSKIISAAWRLFYDKGFDGTTIEDIVTLSETSKGSFYHYFASKDDLIGSLAYLFDEKYEELAAALDPTASALDTLLYIAFAIGRNKLSARNVLVQLDITVAHALCILVCYLGHNVAGAVHEVVLNEPLAHELFGELLLGLALLELLLIALGIEVA